MTKRLPEHLYATYEWIDAAGEIRELTGLRGRALKQYARECEANANLIDGGVRNVSADEVLELQEWLVEAETTNRPT
jgi:hypothetical protein